MEGFHGQYYKDFLELVPEVRSTSNLTPRSPRLLPSASSSPSSTLRRGRAPQVVTSAQLAAQILPKRVSSSERGSWRVQSEVNVRERYFFPRRPCAFLGFERRFTIPFWSERENFTTKTFVAKKRHVESATPPLFLFASNWEAAGLTYQSCTAASSAEAPVPSPQPLQPPQPQLVPPAGLRARARARASLTRASSATGEPELWCRIYH